MAEGAEQLFGWTADDLVGRHFADIVAAGVPGRRERRLEAPDHDPGRRLAAALRPRAQGRVALPGRGVRGHELRRHGVPSAPRARSATSASGSAWSASSAPSEERYRGLVQSSPDLIFEMDGDGVYTFYSDRTDEVIGWRPDELIGHPFAEFVDMAAFPQAAQRLAEIAANPGRPSTDRLLIRHKDGGRTMPFEVSVVGQVDEAGPAGGDPRRRPRHRRAGAPRERELRASEARYRFLVENAPDVVFSVAADTRFLYLSDTIEQITGFRPDELVGDSFTKIVSPETTLEYALRPLDAIVEEPDQAPGPPARAPLRKDGGTVPRRDPLARPDRRGRAGSPGVHGSARDISERERLEAELRASRGALPLGDPVVAGPHLGDQPPGPLRVRLRPRPRPAGLGAEEVLGRPFREFIDEASVETANDELGAAGARAGRHQDPADLPPPQDGVAAPVRGVVGRGRPGRRGRDRVRHRPRRGRARAPRARAARERGALPVPRRELARRHLRHATRTGSSPTSRSPWSGRPRLGPAEVVGRHFRDIVRTRTGSPAGHRFAELAAGRPDAHDAHGAAGKDGGFRPFEVTAVGDAHRRRVLGRPRLRARHPRARAPRGATCASPRSATATSSQSSPDLVWMTDAAGRVHVRVRPGAAAPRLGGGGAARPLVRRPHLPTRAGAARSRGSAGSSGGPRRPIARGSTCAPATGASLAMEITGIGMVADGAFLGRARRRPRRLASASASSAGSGARPRSSRRPRSARTSPASSTTR